MSRRSPYSDDSEGTELRQLVDGSEDNGESDSPRTALLSGSLRSGRGDMMERPRRRRGPSDRYRRERERAHSGIASNQLLRLLVNEEYETRQTRKVLYNALDRLESETRRATDAEDRALELSQRFRSINDARITALQDATRANEELRLYKLRLGDAQSEIIKAQEVLKTIEAQRDEAEASAARARSTARKLNEERLVSMAREEGRRLGFEEGLRRGREIGYIDGQSTGYEDGRAQMQDIATRAIDRVLADEDYAYDRDDGYDGDEQDDADALPHRLLGFSPRVVRAPTPPNSTYADPASRSGRRPSRRTPDVDNQTPITVIPPPGGVQSAPPQAPSTSTTLVSPTSPSGTWPNEPLQGPPRPPSRYSDSSTLPDGYAPFMNADNSISLPAPSQLQRPPPSVGNWNNGNAPPYPPRPPSSLGYSPPLPPLPTESITDTESASTTYGRGGRSRQINTPGTPFVARDFAMGAPTAPQRPRSPESQGSTTISQLDLVSFPATSSGKASRDRSRGLSVIHEDSSSQATRSVPPSRGPSIRSERRANTPQAEAPPFEPPGSTMNANGMGSGYGGPGARFDGSRDIPPGAAQHFEPENQYMADALRYSDPSAVEGWRRQGAEDTRSARGGPPRRRPTNLTTPAPLAQQPPAIVIPSDSLRHQRSRSMSSQPERPSTRTPFQPGHRSQDSSDSSVPDIVIQPPSGPPSDVPDHRASMVSEMLSPEHANRPLPVAAPSGQARPPSRQSGPVLPVAPTTPLITPPPLGPANGLPPGFVPIGPPVPEPGAAGFRSPFSGGGVHPARNEPSNSNNGFTFPPQNRSTTPAQPTFPFPPANQSMQQSALLDQNAPVIPPMSRSKDSSRPYSRARTRSGGSASTATPRTSYAAAPIPTRVQYPDPPSFRSGTPGNGEQREPLPIPFRAGSPASSTSRRSHTRSQSMNAGMTPAANNRRLSSVAQEPLRRTGSNASMTSNRSHSRFDPQTYLDPAYFVDEEAVTRNTATNAATSAQRTPRMSAAASPALSYLTVPNM